MSPNRSVVTPGACLRIADHIVRQAAEESPAEYLGVDSQKDSLAAWIVDGAGREIAASTFENSPSAHTKLPRWIHTAGYIERVGVECSGTYGAGLGRFLVERSIAAFEVPTQGWGRAAPAS